MKHISWEFFQMFRYSEIQERWLLEILKLFNGAYADKFPRLRLYNVSRILGQINRVGFSEGLYKYKFLDYLFPYIQDALNTTGDSAPEKRVPVETYLLEELSKFMSNTLENYPAATYTESVVKVLKGLLLPENYVGVTGHSERIAIMSEVGSDELKSLLEEVDKKVHETAVVFDFGNVLVDWNPDYLYKVQPDYDDIDYQFLREHVLTPDWMTEVDASETMDDLIEAKVHDFPNLEDKIRLFKTNWMEMVKGEVPGMRQLLQEVKQTYRVYGLSNWCKEEFIRAREKYQVLQEVENYVVSGGLCKPDGQKCPPKPSADIYQVFFDQFHLEPKDCFFIDDKQDNVDTALRLGMKAVRFENAEQIRKLLL